VGKFWEISGWIEGNLLESFLGGRGYGIILGAASPPPGAEGPLLMLTGK
jgi:hypothetical protein